VRGKPTASSTTTTTTLPHRIGQTSCPIEQGSPRDSQRLASGRPRQKRVSSLRGWLEPVREANRVGPRRGCAASLQHADLHATWDGYGTYDRSTHSVDVLRPSVTNPQTASWLDSSIWPVQHRPMRSARACFSMLRVSTRRTCISLSGRTGIVSRGNATTEPPQSPGPATRWSTRRR